MTIHRRSLPFLVAGAALAGHAAFPSPTRAQGFRRAAADTATWFSAAGQVRVRGEHWRDFGGAAGVDDGFALGRVLLRGEAQLRGTLRAGIELKSSLASRRTLPGGVRVADEDQLDVQQAWAEVRLARDARRVALRAGRFELSLGRERLVGVSDWTNTRRAFQGAQLAAGRGNRSLQAFWVRPVAVRRRTPNIADSARALYGLLMSRTRPGGSAQLYWLRSESRAAAFNGTTGSERRHTIGARFTRAPAAGRVDADVEAAWQFGSVGGEAARGWMIGATAGRTLRGARAVRLAAGLDAASGDGAAGGAVGTFNQLFPTGHAHLGYIDLHGRQNVVGVTAGASARVPGGATLALDLWSFRRASVTDALYAADGSVVRPAGTGLSRRVGEEIDLTVRRPLARGRVVLSAGASRYLAGPFLTASGVTSDITFVYGQLAATF